ncbi:hypothetical protein VP01_4681g2 [Puccinia sorghi]|uniref:Uncharacterized protein n=1 Tax=Puccinia sorghi TaxID=27349 RepID=A0A0L6UN50_9BASI|nr:hypothetical protein VP01_4681g2 [Puccinia sorghi]
MGTAPPAFTGRKALTTYQFSAIETLIGLKQWYMNTKGDEEYEILPRYLEAVISSFRLITTFLSWKETISRLDGWNPYKERTIAKTLAKIAEKKLEENPTKRKSGKFNYTQAKILQEENPTTMKEQLRRYKIPKKPKPSNKNTALPAPPQNNNKRKSKNKSQPPKYNKNKPPDQPSAKKAKVAPQQMEMEVSYDQPNVLEGDLAGQSAQGDVQR